MLEMSDKEVNQLRKRLSKCKTVEDQKKVLAESGIEFKFGEPNSKEQPKEIEVKEETKDDNQGTVTENKQNSN